MNPVLIAGLASSLLSSASNIALSERQKDYNKSVQDDINEYNLPANQIARLKEAGINPTTLGMGQGYTVAGNQSAEQNPYQLPQLVDPMQAASNSLLSMMNAEESGEKAESERSFREVRIENIRTESEKYRQECNMLQLDQRAQQIANEYADALNEIAVLKGRLDLDLEAWQIEELQTGIEKMQYELYNLLPQQLKESKSRTELNTLEQDKVVALIQSIYKDIEKADAEIENIEAQTETEQNRQEALSADAIESRANAKSVTQQIEFFLDTYDDRVSQIAWDAKMSKRQVKWYIVNSLLHGVQNVGVAAGAVGTGLKAVGAAIPK